MLYYMYRATQRRANTMTIKQEIAECVFMCGGDRDQVLIRVGAMLCETKARIHIQEVIKLVDKELAH